MPTSPPLSAQPARTGVFVLKDDVETQDDIKLAFLELRGLTGGATLSVVAEHRTGGYPDATRAIDAALRLGLSEDRLILAPFERRESLLNRLGMIDSVVYVDRDGEIFVENPAQNAFEKRAIGNASRKALSHSSRKKNDYLTHGFHKYKAKFFPRMARALANFTTPDGGVILDPFMGSGTLGVEASLMGLTALGIDLDPLSVLIAQLKVGGLAMPSEEFRKAASFLSSEIRLREPGAASLFGDPQPSDSYKLPGFIRRKVADEVERDGIERDASRIKDAISTYDHEPGRQLLQLALSHALATKISLRWMGTGDNRFALAVARRPLESIMQAHLHKIGASFNERDSLTADGSLDISNLGSATILQGDSRSLPFPDESVDGIVTSPPYLPASSGRETYLRSRACSLTALDLLTEEEILNREQSMVGSITRFAAPDSHGLPSSVAELVEWMLPQRARAPKALATAAYFLDLATSLREMGRVLRRGGRLALVLSTEHIFYDLISREVVRQIIMPETIRELIDSASDIRLNVDEVVSIRLPKMDYVARPASKGDYSESVMIMTKSS